MQKRQLMLSAVFSMVVCTMAFYFLYYQKTPSYSLLLAYQSVRRHDVASFEARVDLESVLNYAYDDIIQTAGQFLMI